MAAASMSQLPLPMPHKLPAEFSRVAQLVDSRPEAMAHGRGDVDMYKAALAATRMIYELSLETEPSAAEPISKLLSSLTPGSEHAPTTRAQKRREVQPARPPSLSFRPTPKTGAWKPSLGASGIWERMEVRTGMVCGILDAVVTPEAIEEEEEEEESGETEEEEDPQADYVADSDETDDSMSESSSSEEDEDEDEEIVSEGESDLGDTTMELSREEGFPSFANGDDDNDDEQLTTGNYLDGLDLDRAENPHQAARRRAHPTLDDDFFSIDAFNRETEALEAHSRSSGALNEEEEEEDEDVDLFTTVHDTNDSQDDVNDPKYTDFFAPPSKSTKPAQPPARPKRKLTLRVASPPKRVTRVRFNEEVRVRKVKSRRTRASLLAELEDEDEEDTILTSDAMDEDEYGEESESDESTGDESEMEKDDLFAEDEDMDEDGVQLSSYQKRQAALSAEIKALEAENVAPKPWMLQGEATARSRPQNALLAADLEFEHVGKVVPVVTEESVKKLEDRIKERIIEGRYDDVVRKREVEAKPFLPSRTFELKDTRSEKSLAQIYEDEYAAGPSGSASMDDRDGKLATAHEEIEKLWDGVCYKLDALSNAHFTPKQPKAQITTISNVPSATLESALPTSLGTSTLLAPEEVYKPLPNDSRARAELTPGEKRAARTKERKKCSKQMAQVVEQRSTSGRGRPKSVKEAKSRALDGLVKSGKGVTVVGKDSAKHDRKGKGNGVAATMAKESSSPRDSKRLKL